VGELLGRVVHRAPLVTGGGRSGTGLERVRLDDGTELVAKRETGDDLLVQAIGGRDRLARLWELGVLERAARWVEHGIVAVERDGDDDVVFMRDLSELLLPEGSTISRADDRRVLEAVKRVHDEFAGEAFEGLCPIVDRLRCLSPQVHEPYRDRGDFLPPLVLRGWELFPDAVPSDVVEVVTAIHQAPERFADALGAFEQTLIHGDVRLANLGLSTDAVALFDWGILTGNAPRAVEWVEHLAIDVQCIADGDHDAYLAEVRAVEGDAHDPDAMTLAILGHFAMHGWNKALDLFDGNDEVRARQRKDLDWWVERCREAVAIWSPA
jgi:hypothetical protein